MDLSEIDRTLEQIPFDPVKRKERALSQDSTMEDDMAIAEAINEVEKELRETESKGKEGEALSSSTFLMASIVVGSVVAAKLLSYLYHA